MRVVIPMPSVVVVVVALAAAACALAIGSSEERVLVRLTSGHPGAFFNPLGEALSVSLARAMPDIDFRVVPSGGALDNLELLQNRQADFGLTFADIAYLAYSARLDERPVPFDRLRGVAVLQLTAVHILTRKGLRLTSIDQLRGRHVALGPQGSGTAVTARLLLGAYRIPLGGVDGVYLPFLEAADRLARGQLDAIFVTAGFPVESVVSATNAGATLLEITGAAIDRLRTDYPFLRVTVIPARTYPSIDKPTLTVGIDAVIVCSSTLDANLVYEVTKSLFDGLPKLAKEMDALRRMDLSHAPATPLPLHPGAARYYRERELFQ